jgi:tetratricopeptide (TPR) repeat protein
LFIVFGLAVSFFVMTNAETVRDTIIPTAIPTPTRSAAQYAILADLSEQDKEYDQAIDFYQKAIRLDATKAEIFIRLIDLLVREGQAEDALRTAEQATVLAPDNDEVWLATAKAYIANGDRLVNTGDSVGADLEYDKAAAAAERALNIKETSMAYAYAAGGLILQGDAQKIEQAQEYADSALLLESENPIARLYMGKVFELQANYPAAIEQYQLGIEADPALADLYLELAFNYYATGDTSRAINSFEDAIVIDPENAAAYDGVAFMYLQLGQDAIAIEKALEATKLDPQMARAHGRLGQAYFRQFNYLEAIPALEKAVDLYGEITNLNAVFFNMLATAYIRNSSDNCPTAVPIFEQVLTVQSSAYENAQEELEKCRLWTLENQ